MSCMEHVCNKCGWMAFDNSHRFACGKCGSDDVSSFWDEESDYERDDEKEILE